MPEGICMLQNLGNTCYMNSIFQILIHTPELNNAIITSKPTSISIKRSEYELIYFWKDMIQSVYSSTNIPTISPRSLVQCIRKLSSKQCVIYANTQQDASDFIIFIIDVFHKAISYTANIKTQDVIRDTLRIEYYTRIKQLYASNYSEIVTSFYGTYITEIIDRGTLKALSVTFDPYFITNIPVNTNTGKETIYDGLNTIFGSEVLEGDNMWINPDTRAYQSVIKRTQLWTVPNVFIINIKKYTVNYKLECYTDIPHVLELNSYMHETTYQECIYDLYAVCNHVGDLHSGHYYSYVYISKINSWICLNDSCIPYKLQLNQVITSNAVCLFYRSRNP